MWSLSLQLPCDPGCPPLPVSYSFHPDLEAVTMTLTKGSFTYSSGEEYRGEWKEGERTPGVPSADRAIGEWQIHQWTNLMSLSF